MISRRLVLAQIFLACLGLVLVLWLPNSLLEKSNSFFFNLLEKQYIINYQCTLNQNKPIRTKEEITEYMRNYQIKNKDRLKHYMKLYMRSYRKLKFD